MNDDIFTLYLYDCYRVINNGLEEVTTREKIKAHMTAVMPSRVITDEGLARWHYGYIRYACREAEKLVQKAASSKKGPVKNLTHLFSEVKVLAYPPQMGEPVSLLDMAKYADILNKGWLRRLLFIEQPTALSSDYQLTADSNGLLSAAIIMTLARRNDYWPVFEAGAMPRDWALGFIHSATYS